MESKKYSVKGEYREHKAMKKFETTVHAHSDKFAREKALSNFGSKHRVSRNHIKISSVEEVKA